jgi:catechol 2,3-dioxygenase-like lactoylglutathione lyase family enzyme
MDCFAPLAMTAPSVTIPHIRTAFISPSAKVQKPDEAFGRHWCFKARWQTQVDAFWDAGIAAGGTDDGAPGLRDYHASYYAAFLRDPDGNRIEAVCHHAL